ncbi:MAG: CRISPR-associated endonuclease/helicase Cas3 [Actinomycetota bacterium]|nr:CRISPR-associated endonuclease/helicase Cas3 [Actinomycetota bacterium]
MLSSPARSVWAKTSDDDQTREYRWLPLWRHLGDSGAMAGWLWDAWLTPRLRRMCAEAFGGEQVARSRGREHHLDGRHSDWDQQPIPPRPIDPLYVTTRQTCPPIGLLPDFLGREGLRAHKTITI